MIRNFLRLALRHMLRQRAYVFINMLGLAVGITCFVLIGMFVSYELSFDRFNEKYDRIYNLLLDGKIGEQEVTGSWTSAPMAPTFMAEIPEVVDMVRMEKRNNSVIRVDDRSYLEDGLVYADSSFFNFFSIPLLRGDASRVLNAPRKLVLTESAAKKYFMGEDPIGKLMYVGNDTIPYEVTGISADVPANSHFDYHLLASFVTNRRANSDDWFSNSFPAYVILAEGASPAAVEKKIRDVMVSHVGPQIEKVMGITMAQFEEQGGRYGIILQPLGDIHLNADVIPGFKPASDRKYIFIFSLVAILVITIAIINYMNLSTARSAGRAHEVGMRKVLGSSRSLLIGQFLLETVLLSLFALALALVFIEILRPYFNNLIHLQLSLPYLEHWYIIPGLVLLAVFVGILSGSYPAFFLSSFRPLAVLSGKMGGGTRSAWLRSILVVFQMMISIAIIVCTIVIFHQLRYMLNKDLGFDKDKILVVQNMAALGNRIETFRQQVTRIPGVSAASHSTAVPGHANNNNGYLIEGEKSDELYLMSTAWTDPWTLETYGFKLAEGRFFSPDMSTDSFACVINESTVRQFGLKDPLKVRFSQPGEKEGRVYYPVIGVVKDFNYASLHSPIQPHVFLFANENFNWGYLSIRMNGQDYKMVVSQVEKLWKEFAQNKPFQYFFMEQDLNNQYQEEKRTSSLALGFAILAIFIASLGLYGLASFTAEQRTREIGIRKSLGASPFLIVLMLSREVAVLIGIATLLAWPASYLFLKNWLENFSYRISLGPLDFMLSLLIVLVISWLTISYRAFQAARINPATALRHQ